MDSRKIKELLEEAKKVLKNAYAPYSEYRVGAALLAKSGKIYTGVNVENASYGLTVCAERVAVFKAVSCGEREFEAIAIVTEKSAQSPYPCGACRQVLAEFSPDMDVIVETQEGTVVVKKLSELLPYSFKFR